MATKRSLATVGIQSHVSCSPHCTDMPAGMEQQQGPCQSPCAAHLRDAEAGGGPALAVEQHLRHVLGQRDRDLDHAQVVQEPARPAAAQRSPASLMPAPKMLTSRDTEVGMRGTLRCKRTRTALAFTPRASVHTTPRAMRRKTNPGLRQMHIVMTGLRYTCSSTETLPHVHT